MQNFEKINKTHKFLDRLIKKKTGRYELSISEMKEGPSLWTIYILKR